MVKEFSLVTTSGDVVSSLISLKLVFTDGISVFASSDALKTLHVSSRVYNILRKSIIEKYKLN